MKGGPQAMALGCAGFTAFSLFIDCMFISIIEPFLNFVM
jgi:hypothetical protein